MYRMIKSSTNELTLSDMISYIDYFVFYNDIKDAHYQSINASEEIEDEEWYLQLDDKRLRQLTDDKIASFTNIELLGRLYKLMPDRLSESQIKTLKAEYKKTVVINRTEVQKLLKMFGQCGGIFTPRNHPKTAKFLRGEKISSIDILYVIHHLTISDYVANTRSINLNHLGNDMIIFEPKNVKLSDGRELGDITVYVKLDVDETDGSTVAMISFHPAAYEDIDPYFEREDNGTIL